MKGRRLSRLLICQARGGERRDRRFTHLFIKMRNEEQTNKRTGVSLSILRMADRPLPTASLVWSFSAFFS